jgi:tetratricopeptide (TPR) repeat protein
MIASVTLLMALMMPAAQEPAREPASAQEPAAEAAAPASSMSADEHVQAGLADFRRRRFSAAKAHFEQAVEADPNSAAAHYYLGYTVYKIAEPKRANSPGKQEAASHFAKAYELDPAFVPAWRPRKAS